MKTNTTNITFTINGNQAEMTIPSSMMLISLIREKIGLKGTKPGCGEGECGACTVLVDGNPINSCLYLAVNIDGKELTTVEGLPMHEGQDATLDPVQEAMVQHGGIQCGYCTPGMVMSIKAFQQHCEANRVVPDREEIKKALEGNLCRCTGYTKIIDAVESLFRNT